MTNAEKLLNALNEIDDSYLLEVDKRISTVRTRKRATFTSIAAMFVAIILVVVFIAKSGYTPSTQNNNDNILSTDNEFEYNTENNTGAIHQYNFDDNVDTDDFEHKGGSAGGNRGFTGVAINGIFYFEVPYDGIYRYTVGGETELLVKEDDDTHYDYAVNDNGLYYTNGDNTIFRIPHDSIKATTLISSENTTFYIDTYSANDILVISISNSYDDGYGNGDTIEKEFIADGITGEEKTLISKYECIYDEELFNELVDSNLDADEIFDMVYKYTDYDAKEIEYPLGERTLTIIDKSMIDYELTENEETLTKDSDAFDIAPIKASKDYVIFSLGEDLTESDHFINKFYIARASGNDSHISVNADIWPEGNDRFFFSLDYDGENIVFFDVYNNKENVLTKINGNLFDSLYSDGKYIYLCSYSDERNAKKLEIPPKCYKILYNNDDKPYDVELIDENIIE